MSWIPFRVACATAFLSACSGVPEGRDGERERIGQHEARFAGGEPTRGYMDVVAIHLSLVSGNTVSGWFCTGTLIAPDVVLTAASCLAVPDDPLAECAQRSTEALATDARVSVGWSLGALAGVSAVSGFVMPPAPCDNDLALIRLDPPIPEVVVPPRPVRRTPVVAGEALTGVGFGQAEAFLGGDKNLVGGTVSCVMPTCAGARHPDSAHFLSEDIVACGDLGAPALDALGNVIGVVSGQDAACDGATRFTDVTRFEAFLGENAPGSPPAERVEDDAASEADQTLQLAPDAGGCALSHRRPSPVRDLTLSFTALALARIFTRRRRRSASWCTHVAMRASHPRRLAA